MSISARLLRPGATGFDPRSIAGAAAWFDASDLSTLSQTSNGNTPVTANNNPVAYWKCKVSGTALTQGIDASRPLWKSASPIGSKPGLDFDGSNDHLFATSGTLMGVARNKPGLTVFVVIRTDTLATRAWWTIGIGAGTNQFRVRNQGSYINGFNTGGRRLDTDTFATIPTSALDTTTNYVLRAVLDYANSDAFSYVNGTLGASTTSFQTDGNSQDSDSSHVILGSQFSSDAFVSIVNSFDGTLCEWIAYGRALSAAESARVERYLSQKYGIALT